MNNPNERPLTELERSIHEFVTLRSGKINATDVLLEFAGDEQTPAMGEIRKDVALAVYYLMLHGYIAWNNDNGILTAKEVPLQEANTDYRNAKGAILWPDGEKAEDVVRRMRGE